MSPTEAVKACTTMLATLPGQFLALLIVNVCFVGGLLWFLEAQQASRERVIDTIVRSCLERQR